MDHYFSTLHLTTAAIPILFSFLMSYSRHRTHREMVACQQRLTAAPDATTRLVEEIKFAATEVRSTVLYAGETTLIVAGIVLMIT